MMVQVGYCLRESSCWWTFKNIDFCGLLRTLDELPLEEIARHIVSVTKETKKGTTLWYVYQVASSVSKLALADCPAEGV